LFLTLEVIVLWLGFWTWFLDPVFVTDEKMKKRETSIGLPFPIEKVNNQDFV